MGIGMGIGVHWDSDVFSAGKTAAEQALAHLGDSSADLILVFAAPRFADSRFLKGIRSITGTAPLIGCTDAGGISTAGPKRHSATVIAIKVKSGYVVTGMARDLGRGCRHAAQTLVKQVTRDNPTEPRGMLMFPDGLATNGSELVSLVQEMAGTATSIVGASAADDFYFQKTFQFFDDEVMTDAVPGALFCGDVRWGVGVRHGWVPLGRPHRVTKASGRVIYQLDQMPAVSIYEEYLGLSSEALKVEPLANIAMTYPLGAVREGHSEYLLRDAIRVGKAGSLVCTGEVAEGSAVRLMIGGYESALEAAQQAAYDAVEQVGRSRLAGALVFSSVARQKVLGSEYHGEVDVIRDALGGSGVRLGGFYSYGEIAPYDDLAELRRRAVFHNESVVVLGIG